MRILVVGGTRFIGPHVVGRLTEMNHEVVVYHRGRAERAEMEGVRHVHSEDAGIPVRSYPAELLDLVPDIVLHMIAMGEPDAEALMETFRGVARRVVVISSMDVYRAFGVLVGIEEGPPEPVPITEASALRERLYPYAQRAPTPDHWMAYYEKLIVERIVMGDPVLPGTILRLPIVYGPGDYQHRFYPYIKRMDDRRPAILVDEGMARWRSAWGYVENVAQAIAIAVTDDRAANRVYNVADDHCPTVAELIEEIGRAAGWDGRVAVVPKEALPAHLAEDLNTDQHLAADSSLIRKELGFTERVEREQALQRTVAWEREHPPEKIDSAAFDYEAEERALMGRE